jgi:tricorn protease
MANHARRSVTRVRGSTVCTVSAILALAGPVTAQEETLMLRQPDVSATNIAFVYGGDIYVAGRDGSSPRRLTVHPGMESDPAFSPDGQWIAFTGNYEGNADVYVVAVTGGQPKRLSYHPSFDRVRGWSTSGDAVLFASSREIRYERGGHLYLVAVDGGLPTRLPMPVAWDGAFSSDGARIAYQPFPSAYSGASGWKGYRGGRTPPIWLFDMKSHEIEKMPRAGVNDTDPMWIDGRVYFLSDQNRITNVFAYEPGGESVRQITNHADWDIRWANGTSGTIVYEAAGALYTLDLDSEESTRLVVRLDPDLPETRARWVDGGRFVQGAGISPAGKRAVFAMRGDIVTVPADKGEFRNLTRTTGVHERFPLWSSDGGRIAYLTDEGGEYGLVVTEQTGDGETRRYELGDPDFYFLSAWSPSGDRIVYTDPHLQIYCIELESGKRTLIDTHAVSWSGTEVAFSNDGRWLAYTLVRPNHMRALMLYDFETGARHQITEGMSEVASPVFDREGKYLFFTASTNFGPRNAFLDMSNRELPTRRGIYAAVLSADGVTPLPHETGDEEVNGESEADKNGDDEAKPEGKNDEEKETRLDVEGLANRIVALPIAQRNYTSLAVAKDGSLLYLEERSPGITIDPPGSETQAVHTLHKFSFEDRKSSLVSGDVARFVVSHDGTKMLIAGPQRAWRIASTEGKSDEDKRLDLSAARIRIEPRAEWRQMYEEAWRQVRDMFYDADTHGADWDAVHDKYSPLVDHVGRREDLNYIMIEMMAELVSSHARIFAGDFVRNEGAPTGLLGADFVLANGRYRISRIYTGESWNPSLAAPLAVPGVDVREGDYIISINGANVTASDNIYAFLEGTVGKQTMLSVSANANGSDARTATVRPIANERQLRRWAWIEENRKHVDEATDGRVGYIYVPNTAGAGYTYFNRYFFTQIDKEALIVDERGNGGGQAANWIVDHLTRQYTASFKFRAGRLFSVPVGIVTGPKVMLIDMFAGSGGDFLPYSFKRRGAGKLIGTRTWGGLIGGGPGPPLMDGGLVNLPTLAFMYPEGAWGIENEGVTPDIEVEWTPKTVIEGTDPQLERAIVEIMKELQNYQGTKKLEESPPNPTYHRR